MRIRGLKVAVRRHVMRAVARIDPDRYRHEAAYVAALLAKLDDVVLDRPDVRVEFKSTILTDRGPSSAESIWGADFGMTASLRSEVGQIDKGVLGQAKRRSLVSLPANEAEVFRVQVAKMSRVTVATVGLEVPKLSGVAPLIRIVESAEVFGTNWAARSLSGPGQDYEAVIRPRKEAGAAVLLWPAMPLDDYLCEYVVGCPHGDRDERFVRALRDSALSRLHVDVASGT
jgi:hypothetical protein